MKSISLLLSLLASSAHGQIFADFSTTLGDFTVELDYTNSPRTVANFITLAEGSRPWIDSTTGETKLATHYYDGLKFHRVVDDFIIQSGSQNATGGDGPGYSFPDETDNGLTFNSSYLLAMANSGPNTNGSQFFITENTPTFLDGIHTIFGSVTVGQSVIDSIHAVPVELNPNSNSTEVSYPTTDVVINSVLIRREGTAALAFDEFAEDLPVISLFDLTPSLPGPVLDFTQNASTTFRLGLSADLEEWTFEERFLDQNSSPLNSFDTTSFQSQIDRYFYQSSLITWPSDATFPSNLSSRQLTTFTPFDPTTPFTFTFDANGRTGTWNFPRETDPLSGDIVDSLFVPDGYGGTLIMLLDSINFSYWRFSRLHLESDTATEFSGKSSGNIALSSSDFFLGNSVNVDGTYTLSRP